MATPWQAIFIHIPKTAGTTLVKLLERNYPPAHRQHFYTKQAIEKELPKARQKPQLKMLYGHLFLDEAIFSPDDLYVFTMIRHPVDRVISNYLHLKRSKNPRHQEWMKGITEFPQFLEFKQAFNNQCRRIAGAKDMEYFKAHPQEALEQALLNLTRFGLVGITEEFDKSLKLLALDLGWSHLRQAKANVAPEKIEHTSLAQKYRPAIEACNQLDLKLYQAARENLERRWQSLTWPERMKLGFKKWL